MNFFTIFFRSENGAFQQFATFRTKFRHCTKGQQIELEMLLQGESTRTESIRSTRILKSKFGFKQILDTATSNLIWSTFWPSDTIFLANPAQPDSNDQLSALASSPNNLHISSLLNG